MSEMYSLIHLRWSHCHSAGIEYIFNLENLLVLHTCSKFKVFLFFFCNRTNKNS